MHITVNLAVNVALEKTSWMSPGVQGSNFETFATDGQQDSNCAYTTAGTDPWWQVDLENSFIITAVFLQAPSAGFSVY